MTALKLPGWLQSQLTDTRAGIPSPVTGIDAEYAALVAAASTTTKASDGEVEAKIAAEQQRQFVASEAKRRNAAALTPLAPLRVYSLTELMKAPSIQWHVRDIVARGTVNVFGGDGGVGKSAMLIELSARIGTGTPFLREYATTQGRVLYVAAEGRAGYGPRLNAVQKAHGAIPEGQFALVDDGVSLTNDASVAQLCELVRSGAYDVVILDTLSQLAAVDSENDNAEMARVINQAKSISNAREGTSVLIVAHTNKSSGTLRGSSAIRDNVDAVWMVRGTRDAFSLSNKPEHGGKMRDGTPLTIHGLSLAPAFGSVVVESAHLPRDGMGADDKRANALGDLLVEGDEYATAQLRELIRRGDPQASDTTAKRTISTLIALKRLTSIAKGRYRA